ncbi:hypothetical protein BU26DRAFT_553647 [Trematosphaeria pertusa]|uniref:Uncharacterized protein n=1 Tax=Trematosphaeria pertusa TaxID=390896 RepID=A0A6A6I3P9_9PLEO|nr:uncharacterized protein BU26DRAFT_553647 [Trematosphaeria pertusa]KAF2245125.1 hypothetical protein BU26DRAFT_553647 [Trematosphaeria pertusa]
MHVTIRTPSTIVAPMDCTNTWLAVVHAVGGDLEPPPNPEIPAEYLQKPRRRPAPDAYLPSPPLSTCTSLARPKRRRAALSEIDPPNQKRQPAPVLMPSVSEEQTDEGTEVESAHESTTSKRSRSPTRRMTKVKQDSNGNLDDLEDYVAKTSNGKTHEELKDEFKAMQDIRNETLLDAKASCA